MEKAKELINQIYLDVKKRYPEFEYRKYDTSDTVYFGQTSRQFPGKNGNGFKFYKEYNRYKVGVKSNLKTGKLDDHVFLLPEQFEQARACIFTLYEIPLTTTSTIQSSIKEFERALIDNGIRLEPKPSAKGTTTRFLSEYDSSFAPVIVSSDEMGNKPIIRIKKYAPLSSDKNKEENGYFEYDLFKSKNSRFINPIEKIHILLMTVEAYNNVSKSPVLNVIRDIAFGYNLKVIDLYGENFEFKIILSKGFELVALKSKGKMIIRAKNRITGEISDFDFSEDGAFEAFGFLFKYQPKVEPIKTKEFKISLKNKHIKLKTEESSYLECDSNGEIVWLSSDDSIVEINNGVLHALKSGTATITAKNGTAFDTCVVDVEEAVVLPPLSAKAQYFVEQVAEIKSESTADDFELLFEQYDELKDEDCNDSRVTEAYELLKALSSEEDAVPQSVRFVYASKSFLKEVESLESEYLEYLEGIKKSFNTLKSNELANYLISKRLVYIDGYLKIRVKNGDKHRIIFCFGNKLGKNPKDIYVFDYNRTHDFSNIRNLHPEEQQYSLWALDKPKIVVPPLTKKQEAISLSVDKPLICTGCAGSGKTLISVYMYIHLLDKDFNGIENVKHDQLVYVTYNENARDNAANQIKEIVDFANCKTIFEFFYDIAKPDLEGLTYADENNFVSWWKNEITNHLLKIKMNSLSKSNPIKYVYTFFRGLYKGSMFRWELTHDDKCLTREQMINLLNKEPIEEERVNLIYDICELYQQYLDNNKMYDDNDLARFAAKRLSKGIVKKFNHIIIDEVQDLTEVQLDAVVKASSDKRKLYFFGDQNQSINPTLFNLDFIEMCLLTNDSSIETEDIYKLTNSYRFGPHLAKYINKLVKLKQQWIGTLSAEETEGSNKDIEKNRWAGKTHDSKVISTVLLKAANAANAIIIVPDHSVKEELKEKYGEDFAKRVTTIYDSKGLEWDYVVLYNMLKFNEDKYEEMVDGKGKYSTLHRMIFNQYYVGCTRALSCFTVLETELDKKVEEPIIGDLQTVTDGNLGLYIQEENDPTSWYKEAIRLFDAGIYDLAMAAFEKAEVTIEEEPKMEICSLLLAPSTRSDLNIAALCKEKGFYREASRIYQNAGKYRLSQLMNLYNGINISDEDAWDIIMNEKLSESDMEVINKSGFLTNKSNRIVEMIKKLSNELKGK